MIKNSSSGLHCRVIKGFLKGSTYFPNHIFTEKDSDDLRGSWNAVLIDGKWRLVDTHWGSRYVLGIQMKSVIFLINFHVR